MKQLRHPRGASCPVPEAWTCEPVGDDAVAAVEPGFEGQTFRANLVITAVDNGGLGFRDWQVATDRMLPQTLGDYLLLDLEKLDVAGHPGGRRLAHHTVENGDAVVMEQWFTLVDGVGYTLTATIDAFRYDQAADDLAEWAAGLSVGGPA